ncbi:hypothetical protein EDC04DRAFT_2617150 [Pisolithus marmoratus]|nr:hypothetical protein EDC04DRAFT_2617150 [Pisolithus marmoratus]
MAKCDTTKKLFDQLANMVKLPMCNQTLILSETMGSNLGLYAYLKDENGSVPSGMGRSIRLPDKVDQPTSSKMEEMLITWQTGAPNGKELFGVIMQLSIEQGICGSYSTSPADICSIPFKSYCRSSHPKASSQSYLNTISKVQKDGVLQANPWDLTAQKHIDQVQPLPSSYPMHPAQSTHICSHTHHHGAPVAHPTYSYQSEQSKLADISTLIPVALSSTLSSPLPLTNIATLYNALLKAGVISAGGHIIHKSLTRSQTTGNKKAVLSEKVKLTMADILGWVILSWCLLPMQCKQCGLRFSDDLSGKKWMDNHLDMHFRQNSGVRQNVGCGHSRCWFIFLEMSRVGPGKPMSPCESIANKIGSPEIIFKCPACHEKEEHAAWSEPMPYFTVQGNTILTSNEPTFINGMCKRASKSQSKAESLAAMIGEDIFQQKIFFISIHSEVTCGDLFAGKEGDRSDVVVRPEEAVFSPFGDSHLRLSDRLRPMYTVAFGAKHFISVVIKLFIVAFGHDLGEVFKDLLDVSIELPMHTDTYIFQVKEQMAASTRSSTIQSDQDESGTPGHISTC